MAVDQGQGGLGGSNDNNDSERRENGTVKGRARGCCSQMDACVKKEIMGIIFCVELEGEIEVVRGRFHPSSNIPRLALDRDRL